MFGYIFDHKITRLTYPIQAKIITSWVLCGCTKIRFIELDWTGLDWTGLDWTGLDWTIYD